MLRRPGFTLTEMLIAAAVTALVATAATTMTVAVSNASSQTKDFRQIRTAGNFALANVSRTVCESRGIGEVTSNSIGLWLRDANNDDQVNLYECGIIRYDTTAKQLRFEYMQSATEPPPSTTVNNTTFKNTASLDAAMGTTDRKIVIWADDVTQCTFTGYPNYTETRIAEIAFTIQTGGGSLDFRGAMSPKASADYLFSPTSSEAPPPTSTRKVRKKISKWTGLD